MSPKPAAVAGPLPAGPAPLALLAPIERFAFRVLSRMADSSRAVAATEWWLRSPCDSVMHRMIDRILEVRGVERLAGIPSDAPLVMVANHRTYFDMYLLSVLLNRHTRLHQPVYCPVRSDFFYDHPVGVAVNLLMGGRMYPPVFRDPTKADFNKWAVAAVCERLRAGNVLVGFHPEGRRNKNEDVYTPLPAQPGVGKVVMETWPIVIPAFVNGLTNNMYAINAANLRRSHKIAVVFGEPVDLSSFRNMSNRLATHKRIADRLLEVVYRLGEEERVVRAGAPALAP